MRKPQDYKGWVAFFEDYFQDWRRAELQWVLEKLSSAQVYDDRMAAQRDVLTRKLLETSNDTNKATPEPDCDNKKQKTQ